MNAITAEGLVKIYRTRKNEVRALDGLDLEVEEGTVLGLLGPNGAGKTTAVRILSTLLRPDAGRATVAGFDVVHQAEQLRRVIGLSGQYAAVDENLTDADAAIVAPAGRRMEPDQHADGVASRVVGQPEPDCLDQLSLAGAGPGHPHLGRRDRRDLRATGRAPLPLDEPLTAGKEEPRAVGPGVQGAGDWLRGSDSN